MRRVIIPAPSRPRRGRGNLWLVRTTIAALAFGLLAACNGSGPEDPLVEVDAWADLRDDAITYAVAIRNLSRTEVVLTWGGCTPQATLRLYRGTGASNELAWDGVHLSRMAEVCPAFRGPPVGIPPGESLALGPFSRDLSRILADSLPRGVHYLVGVVPVFEQDLTAHERAVGLIFPEP